MEDVMFVRLKERNPKIGLNAKTRTIMDPHTGGNYTIKILDNGQRPWNKVPAHIATICQTMRVNPNNRFSPLTFEVCTESEALALDAMAKREREARMAVEEPTVATAVDQTRRVPSSQTVGDLTADDVAPPARARALATATGPAATPPEPPAPAAAPKRAKKSTTKKSGTTKKRGRPKKK